MLCMDSDFCDVARIALAVVLNTALAEVVGAELVEGESSQIQFGSFSASSRLAKYQSTV